MSDHNERRKSWRLLWLSTLAYFSDADTQRSKWLDLSEENPHWTFVELMCSYFDDCFIDDNYNRWSNLGYISLEEISIVMPFHILVDRYNPPNGDDYDHKNIITDPKWQTVCSMACHCLDQLVDLLDDPDERDALRLPII